MGRNFIGWFLFVGGIIGLFLVHSMHPPEGISDAFGMMLSGRENYIREPYYSWALMIFFAITVTGGAILLQSFVKKDAGADKES